MFDERLRAATFDHHARAIALQLGSTRAECSEARLAAAFRARAVAAATPAEFQRVLVDMLLSLQDPHVDFEPTERPWQCIELGAREYRDDAEPEFADVVRSDGSWWIASRPPLTAAGAKLAERLLSSSGDAAVAPRWYRLEALDGRAIRSRKEAQLLLRGPLLQPVQATVRGPLDERTTIELPRNAMRTLAEPGVVMVVPPRQLAARCDPSSSPSPQVSVTGPALDPFATYATSRAAQFRVGTVSRQCDGFGLPHDMQVWRDGPVGYLRLGSFHVSEEAGAALRALDGAMADLATCDTVIVDLLDNLGGNWMAMGYAASFFLPATDAFVPHRGEVRTVSGAWLFSTTTIEVSRLSRAPVPQLRPAKLFVLVDQWTASAAEILAAVLRCKAGAILIGERTVGAETWIQLVDGPDGSRITFGLPGGMDDGCPGFQGVGLMPDRFVGLAAEHLQAAGLEPARRAHRHAIRSAAFAAAGLDPAQVLAGP